MKYVHEGYREFRGYVFRWGLPVDITDRGTLEAVKRDPSFKEFKDEEKAATETEVLDACPKCGKVVRQGRYLHVKHCKGLQ